MFTGIIEEIGEVRAVSRRGATTLLEISAPKASQDTGIGDSISVNGACLTVVRNERGVLSFEVLPETLKVTNLAAGRVKVNLERALKAGMRLSGHFVTGHVDCAGVITKRRQEAGTLCLEITVPAIFMEYILPKGSVAVDGISLTIAGSRSNTFRVCIIPHTLKHTTLGLRQCSDKVNVEFDILAKRAPRARPALC